MRPLKTVAMLSIPEVDALFGWPIMFQEEELTLLALKSVNELIFAFYSTYKRPSSLLPFMLLNINLK